MSAYEAFYAAQSALSRAHAAANNQAKICAQVLTYNTKGTGYLVVQAPFNFPVRFTEEPTFTFGGQLLTRPDQVHWRMPTATVGVTAWVTEPNAANPSQPFYVGASVYIHVLVLPINIFDGAYLNNNPPRCVMNHHMRFEGTAMKILPGRIIDGIGDGVDTNTPNYGNQGQSEQEVKG